MKTVLISAIILLGVMSSVDAGTAIGKTTPQAAISTSSFWDQVNKQKSGVFLAACCKTCRKGKACGDSCISRSKSCRKGAGCACDG